MNKNTAQRISRLIKEVLSAPPTKKDKCSCGCNTCKNVGNPGPILNESLNAKPVLSENMKYHVDNKLALTENTFRYGSEAFLNLWNEARTLYKQNAIHLNDVDKELVMETDLGKWGMYEGKKVPLDLLMLEENSEFNVNKVWDFIESRPFYNKNYMPKFNTAEEIWDRWGPKEKEMYDNFEWTDRYEGKLHPKEKSNLQRQKNYNALKGITEDSELGGKEDVEFTTNIFMVPYLSLLQAIEKDWGKRDLYYEVEQALFDKDLDEVKRILQKYEVDKEYANLLNLNEVAKKKKTPPIGKPKRGGSKKFYVYVRKPGGGIKKVSFGMAGGGLRAKLNNPKARQAFAKRHNCAQAKDRTTARYWSCRLPRYAKLLGFKTTFSGYW